MNESIEELLASGAVVPDRPGSKRLVPAAQSVVVPVEPTPEMTMAGAGCLPSVDGVFGLAVALSANVWSAMLAAAPAPSSLAGGAVETLRTLLDNLVIAQSLSKEIRTHATDEARAYLYDTRLAALSPEAPARDTLPEDDELPGDFLARVGMDGALWATEFRKMALKLGYSDMDEGWLIGWFCNAVMAGYDHAQRKFDPALTPRHEAPAPEGARVGLLRDALIQMIEHFERVDAPESDKAVIQYASKAWAGVAPHHEATADQTERWAKALYDNNAFYHPDPEDAGWPDMAPNDGGIHDLHMDMARAAKAVWDCADEAPAEGAGERELLPCPFCGGDAEIVHIEDGENEGGSCVCCTVCQASGNLEFERKENFISNWNRRARSSAPEAREEALGNLLAVIHGDGGHRALEVGVEQAAAEAEKIAARLLSSAPEAREGGAVAWRTINVNDTVQVKLTDLGRETHKAYWEPFSADKYQAARVDGEGWSEFQLWDLMAVFGPKIHLGMDTPFETAIRVKIHPAAPSADKLRTAAEALEPFALIGSHYRTGGLRQDIENRAPGFMRMLDFRAFRRADQALAVLNAEG